MRERFGRMKKSEREINRDFFSLGMEVRNAKEKKASRILLFDIDSVPMKKKKNIFIPSLAKVCRIFSFVSDHFVHKCISAPAHTHTHDIDITVRICKYKETKRERK